MECQTSSGLYDGFLFFPIKNSMVFLDSGIFNESHLEVYINIAKEKNNPIIQGTITEKKEEIT